MSKGITRNLDLEERSLENLINFYSEELIQLSKGTTATELFTQNTRRTLIKYGVIKKGIGGYYLTEKTKMILGK